MQACAGRNRPDVELVGAPRIVTPQMPTAPARYDTVGQGAATDFAENIAVPSAPSQVGQKPAEMLPSLEDIISSQAMVVESAPARQSSTPSRVVLPQKAPTQQVRNPSFQTRVPPPAPKPVPRYKILTSNDLMRVMQLQASFQASSADLNAPISRLGDAAEILRANPDVILRVTGFALDAEIGGRALALRRAQFLAAQLRELGTGGARIETEGKLVLMGKATSDRARAEVTRAARRAQVSVVSGTPTVDPFEPGRVPRLGMPDE